MELGKRNMFPCILQLLFLVMELTGILISLSKGSGWEGSLFRLVKAFRCSVSQERVQNPWERISKHPDLSCEAGPDCGNVMLCILCFWLPLIGAPFLLHALLKMWALEYHLFHSTGICTLAVYADLESDQAGHPQQHGFHSTKYTQLDWDFQIYAAISILLSQLEHWL